MLTIDQILNRDLPRSRRAELSRMQYHQDWVKMHAESNVTVPINMAYQRFLERVRKILPPYKYDLFTQLIEFPLATTEVVSVVFDRLSRVFEGRNPVYNYEFATTADRKDWEEYRQEVLDEPYVWKNKAWDYYKTEFNSVVVVDMPVVSSGRPEPYFYWVTVDNIIDYSTDEEGRVEWIIFKNTDRRMVYAIDDTFYRSFPMGDDGFATLSDAVTENRHGLGYCPVSFFMEQPLSLRYPDVKKSPISDVLSALDWYLFFHTSEKHLNLYASYPIYSGYEKNCGYEREIGEGSEYHIERCHGGLLYDEQDRPCVDANGHPKRCPVCGDHQITGAGTFLTVPEPGEASDGSTVPDMIEAVKMLGVDHKALKFNDEKVSKLENAIINKCVGVEGNVFTEFSISDKQVDANYESQSTILVRVKKAFESIQWFVDDTICKLRYGSAYLSCQIDYGTEFYTLTTEQLRERYTKAKEGGASQSDLSALRRKILETEYRSDPLVLRRMIVLSDIEPLLGVTLAEAREMLEEGVVSREDVMIKANFESLIRRFERENTNITTFASTTDADYYERIDKIRETLKHYINEYSRNH